MQKMKRKMIIGNQEKVKQELILLQKKYNVDELMIVTIAHSPVDRIQLYKLIAEALL